MAPGLQSSDGRFPPNAPIPGRGLPPDVCARIPTLRFRLLRAGGLFVTSLGASAALAVGPAVVLVKVGTGAAVTVEPSFAIRRAAPDRGRADRMRGPGRQLRRDRHGVCARAPVVVAGTGGAPQGGSRDAGLASRRAVPPQSAAAALRAGGPEPGRLGPAPHGTLSRRPRPPPRSANRLAHRRATLIALAPATPPRHWWCAPDFLFSPV